MATVAESKAAADTSAATTPATDNTVPMRPVASQAAVDETIRHHVYGAIALGFAPIPLVDLVGLIGIQLNLVRSLSQKYGVAFQPATARPIITTLLGSVVPIAIASPVMSLLKAIPIVGYVAGASSLSILFGAATYAVGQSFARHFAAGGGLHDYDVKANQAAFKTDYETGKTVAGGMASKPAAA